MRSKWVLPAVVLVVVGLVAAGATYLVLGGSDDGDVVALEPAKDDGPDPFTDSVSLTDYDGVPAAAGEVVRVTFEELPDDDGTGTRRADGAVAGLYGGTTDGSTCDVAKLEAFLTDPANGSKADAWADVLGIGTDEISTYLSTLTPTTLTVDTRVTNHGFAGGRATPRQSVLQAGSAVLVDDVGVPRVRCSCGNPLTEPESLDLGTAATTGTPWSGFDTARVVTPAPASAPIGTFTLVDLEDGSTFEREAGSLEATWVAVAGSGTPTGGRGALGDSGSVHVSTDGATWDEVLRTEQSMNAVEHGDGRFVAVGATAGGAGVVMASDNGTTWSEPVDTGAALVDVAYGDGTWVALAADRTYTSSDGANWQEQAPLPLEFEGISAGAIAHGPDGFIVSTYSCGASRCPGGPGLLSTDGVSWTQAATAMGAGVGGAGVHSASLAATDEYAIAGYSFAELPAGASMADQTTDPTIARVSTEGAAAVTLAEGSPYLFGLSAAGGRWYGVGSTDSPMPSDTAGVWTSDDLSTWTRVGEVAAPLRDVAVAGTPARTEPPADPVEDEADGAAGVVIRTAGLELVDADGAAVETLPYGSSAADAVSALTDVLGAPSATEALPGDGTCSADSTAVRWGAFALVHEGSDAGAVGEFSAFLSQEGDLGPVTGPGGIVPGASEAAVRATAPGALEESAAFEGQSFLWILLDAPAGPPESTLGVLATVTDGVVTGLAAPEYVSDLC